MVGFCRTSITVALAWIWTLGVAQAYHYTHVVLPGESVVAIARRYHITPAQLLRQNRLHRPHLRAGQKLAIRTPVPSRALFKTRYRVRRGDSLSSIAKRHRMRLSLLRRLNHGARVLHPGQLLWVVTEGPRPGGARGLYRLTRGPGYDVGNSRRAWGTFLTVTRLMEVLADHARRYPGRRPISVGDLSRKGGGFLPPHKSHRRGRDVDIRFPLKIESERYAAATPKTLDVERTWDLIQRFIHTGDVTYIFVDYHLERRLYDFVAKQKKLSRQQLQEYFQYPRRRGAMVGIVRHEPGHATHMHVRFVKERRPAPPNT